MPLLRTWCCPGRGFSFLRARTLTLRSRFRRPTHGKDESARPADEPPVCRGTLVDDHRRSRGSPPTHARLAGRQLRRAVASQLGVEVPAASGPDHGVPDFWLNALVEDLLRHRGRSVVIAGEGQPPWFTHWPTQSMLNWATWAARSSTRNQSRHAPRRPQRTPIQSVRSENWQMRWLPVKWTHCSSLGAIRLRCSRRLALRRADGRVPFLAHLGIYENETSDLCHWHIPEAHFLESWADVRSYDGTISFVQPLIAPLHNGRTPSEVLSLLTGQVERSAHEILRPIGGVFP